MRGFRDPYRLLQATVLGLVAYGLVRGNVVLVVNGLLGVGVTLVPWLLRRYGGVEIARPFVLWIGVAVLAHTLGMAGPYETIWWWDHLTHTLSAALLASLGYALARTLETETSEIRLPADFLLVFVVIFTLAAGVLWEVLEFLGRLATRSIGRQPILIQYGLQDTVLDLLFDGVGAIVVGLWGQRWVGRSGTVFTRGGGSEDGTNRKSP